MQAGQSVFSVAQDGGRDAVFNVYEETLSGEGPTDPAINLRLASNPALKAKGSLREYSPTVDPSTGTVRVKIGDSEHPPAEMALGAAVVGEVRFNSQRRITVPGSACSSDNGRPAAWTVDASTKAASLKPITESYEAGRIVVREGLRPGQLVVTEGAQLLRPNQTVSLADGAIS